jgi:hypothetical protein
MPKQKLDLFQITTVFATELRAGPAQVVGAEVLDPNLLCRLLDDRPDRSVAQLIADQLPALGKRPQQAAVLDLARDHPGVDSVLDPEWNCHGADSAALPTKIGQDPSALSHLDAVNVQTGFPQNTDTKARLGMCASIKSMIYSRALRNMEVQRARHNKLFIVSKGCCLPYSMIRILKRPLYTRRRQDRSTSARVCKWSLRRSAPQKPRPPPAYVSIQR